MIINRIFKHHIFYVVLIMGCVVEGLFVKVSVGYPVVVDRIVAVVNDDIVILSELNEKILPYVEKLKTFGYSREKEQEILYKVREDVLNRLIEQKLKDYEIRNSNITVDEAEIDNAIERIKETSFFTDEDLREALARDGLTLEAYREDMKEQILRSKLINYKIKSKIVITREEIRAYYDNHKEDYSGDTEYHLRNIIMKIPVFASEDGKQEVIKKMEGILDQLREGESFEDLARNYSESSLASSGGDLGLFVLSDLSKNIQEAVMGLNPGEFTPVIETDQGYQIFFLEEIIDATGKTLEAVSPAIEEKLYNEALDKKFQTWLSDLREQAHIKIIK